MARRFSLYEYTYKCSSRISWEQLVVRLEVIMRFVGGPQVKF